MTFTVYILRTSVNKLYIGYTRNLPERLMRHAHLDGALLLRSSDSFELVYQEEYGSQKEAIAREKQLKGWTRAKKEALIAGSRDLLKKL